MAVKERWAAERQSNGGGVPIVMEEGFWIGFRQ